MEESGRWQQRILRNCASDVISSVSLAQIYEIKHKSVRKEQQSKKLYRSTVTRGKIRCRSIRPKTTSFNQGPDVSVRVLGKLPNQFKLAAAAIDCQVLGSPIPSFLGQDLREPVIGTRFVRFFETGLQLCHHREVAFGVVEALAVLGSLKWGTTTRPASASNIWGMSLAAVRALALFWLRKNGISGSLRTWCCRCRWWGSLFWWGGGGRKTEVVVWFGGLV